MNADGVKLSLRLPAGRDTWPMMFKLHLPRDARIPGTLPPLEPKGVIFSHSFYLDLGVLWQKRTKIMYADNAKSFEEGVKEAGRFLIGTSIEKLLA